MSSPTFSSPATIFMFFCFFFINLPFSNSLLKSPLINASARRAPRQLSVNYYAKSCPQVESLVGSVTSNMFKEAPASGPATIRLFFHDCFVEGCDGSILISSKAGSKELAEKDAEDNKDIAKEAFEGINKAKVIVESKCPGVVSCADILAIATRNFVHLVNNERRCAACDTAKRGKKRRLDVRMTCLWADTIAPRFSGGFSGLLGFSREEEED